MGRLSHSQVCLFRILHLMTLFWSLTLCAVVYRVSLLVRSPLLILLVLYTCKNVSSCFKQYGDEQTEFFPLV